MLNGRKALADRRHPPDERTLRLRAEITAEVLREMAEEMLGLPNREAVEASLRAWKRTKGIGDEDAPSNDQPEEGSCGVHESPQRLAGEV
jgi:hypothetical protein